MLNKGSLFRTLIAVGVLSIGTLVSASPAQAAVYKFYNCAGEQVVRCVYISWDPANINGGPRYRAHAYITDRSDGETYLVAVHNLTFCSFRGCTIYDDSGDGDNHGNGWDSNYDEVHSNLGYCNGASNYNVTVSANFSWKYASFDNGSQTLQRTHRVCY